MGREGETQVDGAVTPDVLVPVRNECENPLVMGRDVVEREDSRLEMAGNEMSGWIERWGWGGLP